MKALSVKQPHAELLVSGVKGFETRSWLTTHRGPLAIHASLREDEEAMVAHGYAPGSLPLGRIVGSVDITACVPFERQHERLACTPWRPNTFAWRTENARRLDSVLPVPGRLGIWTLPPGLLTEVQHA